MIFLPVDAVLLALTSRHEAILEASPGAGKTTRAPLVMLDEPWLAGQTILMLEPRRLAARAAAERLASELGVKVGETGWLQLLLRLPAESFCQYFRP
ncbi:hypothetical protein PSCICN_45730 [Pseudomonas cichorii]|nr:hypothetical protein [Pseudomonas cichorii]GFM83881.1 hypothetical protein PSCICN_45730 [Pseudomonas cichorii]